MGGHPIAMVSSSEKAHRARDLAFDPVGGPMLGQLLRSSVRLRFLLETVDSVATAIGGDRVAVRISPEARIHDAPAYSSERQSFLALTEELSKRKISYLT
jgi:NADH:flavin oxidoreductase / NADH oxidase family